jgi:hypothetical protein
MWKSFQRPIMAAEWLNDKLSWMEPFVIQQQWRWVGQEEQGTVCVLTTHFPKVFTL